MWKQWLFVIGIVALAISIVSNYFLAQQNETLKQAATTHDEEIEVLEQTLADVEAMSSLNVSVEEIDRLHAFFEAYLQYNNDTYTTRFQEMARYANQRVIEKLQGAAVLDTPIVPVENELVSMEVYISPNKPHEFFVYTKTNYYANGVAITNTNMLFEVEIEQENHTWTIRDIRNKGNVKEVDDV
ncbi:MAG: hypothetical protein UHX00_01295 [Caryophanon sp.]|nr:hypothetical protein [Caryophanon sp.]